ncbi:MAG: TatD family hydrolase [Candidatus Omnitrophica bacterium]|nr:TatD family hydrolase [Candidatus Omnitrophota bacterium]
MKLIDTHAHLHFQDFDQDRDEVIRRAREAGMELFITVGSDVVDSEAARKLSEKYDCIFSTVGIHPHDAVHVDESVLQTIQDLLGSPRVIAIGEVGLDFYRDLSPRQVQEDVLRKFFAIHREIKKPLVLHCRDAYDQLIHMIEEELRPPCSGIIHCFSSDRQTLMRLVDLGFYIAFGGALTYKTNDKLREACQACPPDRLLLETDAPYLPPQSKRGRRNEPGWLVETAEKMAELHGLDLERIAEVTTRNAKAVLQL